MGSPKFVMSHAYARHDGGTKAYQIWLLHGNGRSFTVHQYGKVSAFGRASGRGGAAKTAAFRSNGDGNEDYNDIRNEKSKRGYRFEPRSDVNYVDAGAFQRAVNRTFPVEIASAILAHLEVDGDPVTSEPEKPLKAYKEPEPEIDRGSEWGAW